MKHPDTYFKIAELISGFLDGTLSKEESVLLKEWIENDKKHEALFGKLTNPVYVEDHLHYWGNRNTDHFWEKLTAELKGEETNKNEIELPVPRARIIRNVLQYAAVILPIIILGSASWYFYHHQPEGKKQYALYSPREIHIMPKGQVAQLVLGNGAVLNLNDSLQETITEKDGTKVHNRRGVLSYVSSKDAEQEMVYNTLIVPRGGVYQITLPDGTKVWLNAASSLRYPTRFNGKERRVYLNGEGYFEVAKNASQPFIVNAGNTDVTVLGTKFDISNYSDDATQKVVLAEGAVSVNEVNSSGKESKDVLLRPGLGALIRRDQKISVDRVNVEAALGWKNGMFIFDGESLGSIMKKMERWYNVQVQYEDGVNTRFHFTGRIKRFENITGLLNLIEMTGKVKFSIVGNEVVVSPIEK